MNLDTLQINLLLLLAVGLGIYLLWRLRRQTRKARKPILVRLILDEKDTRGPVDFKKIVPGKNTITVNGKKYMIVAKDEASRSIWYAVPPEDLKQQH